MTGEVLLQAQGVVRKFGNVTALDGVSMLLRSGELFGLVGPDGAGKTTLIRALVGLIDIDSGRVTIKGTTWSDAPPQAREQLGYMPQQYSLYTDLSVDENLTFFGKLFDVPRAVFKERRKRLLGITQLEHAKDRLVGALSGGMYKKLAIACALLHRPDALILDEPTNGVDPVSRRELWALLHEFVKEGMGVLVSTPYMDEATRCSRVALLYRGTLLADGQPSSLVAGFQHVVLEFKPRTSATDSLLTAHSRVIAFSPSGEQIRVVVHPDSARALTADLERLGAAVGIGRPDFEDLYLSLIAQTSGRERP
jgi:ABC-2 type transport system ATP-binding protein